MDSWPMLLVDLDRYVSSRSAIQSWVIQAETKCRQLIEKIGGQDFDESQADFDVLFGIQQELAQVQQRYDFPLADHIRDFVYLLDGDDVYSRKSWQLRFRECNRWPGL